MNQSVFEITTSHLSLMSLHTESLPKARRKLTTYNPTDYYWITSKTALVKGKKNSDW